MNLGSVLQMRMLVPDSVVDVVRMMSYWGFNMKTDCCVMSVFIFDSNPAYMPGKNGCSGRVNSFQQNSTLCP